MKPDPQGVRMARFIEPVTLVGNHATLEPLDASHVAPLAEAASDGMTTAFVLLVLGGQGRRPSYIFEAPITEDATA